MVAPFALEQGAVRGLLHEPLAVTAMVDEPQKADAEAKPPKPRKKNGGAGGAWAELGC